MRDCPYCDATAEYEATFPKHVDIVFDAAPGPDGPRFIEVEDDAGKSIRFGEWVQREDGNWALRFNPRDPMREPKTLAGAIEDIRSDLREIMQR